MSLDKYNEKRSFAHTPEPKGGNAASDQLQFVIQKHDASRLHYDFRLEMDGVLKSWAVPKGPSTDPSVKRLAMMVEDHPYDYKDFEGIIPEGNYGSGTVMVWDNGTYEPLETADTKEEQIRILLRELESGSLKFRLNGQKLKGEFALVKTRGMGGNAWLLIKHRDAFASESDITENDKSVISDETIETIKKASKNIYGSDLPENAPDGPERAVRKWSKNSSDESENQAENRNGKARIHSDISDKSGKSEPFPETLDPMLATLVDEPFDDPGWEYEVKWDGYRAVAFLNEGKVELQSRNRISYNQKFYPVYQKLADMKLNAVLDGEIVVINDKGHSDFNALQNWHTEENGTLVYYVFDILWLDGKGLLNLPLSERKAILQTIIPQEGVVRTGYSIVADGKEFFKAAAEMGLEGIMAKKSDSKYFPGTRTNEWLKIKIHKRQEVIIVGYTRNAGTPRLFSALLLGVYENGFLKYVGKVGTGFNMEQQRQMLETFKPYITQKNPFKDSPEYNKPSRLKTNPAKLNATWLKPELICEVSFTEVTADGIFRHPSFEGMREDKKATEVVKEVELPTEKILNEAAEEHMENQPAEKADGKKSKSFLNAEDETQIKKLNGSEVKFTNLSKFYWEKEKITKRDLIQYYHEVAPYILPYLKNRPLSLYRFPNGITEKGFYQKDVTGKVPDWIRTFPYKAEGDDEQKNFMLCNDEASLLYAANLGCIDMHPWNSRTEQPDYPDWCLLDLDPDPSNTFNQVITTAQTIKQLLDSLHVPSFCKTSGSTGIHVYIPLDAKYNYDQCQLFAQWIASRMQQELPDFTSIERMTKDRKGKIYIDYMQNRPQATLAAPYSVRPKPGATVSMPLHWDEVKKGLKLQNFTIFNAMERIKNEGDLFKPVLDKGINLEQIISKIEQPEN
ncbi:DNA ligase D [Dyadobacter sediminis]|uniref:DNA ligase (ATP) n=1 Tax=Dyadobacter sediminis TaxID=1493691 RepID=A0A5R9KIW7_9BACT|nr:DNA ligase D [Dyadobacter sediminis]TLU96155.1 DNA ligase D [Dyadobacter sediminis]GGB79760.1 ATP-dependent DNA ligase [Dyadobacter sediminis]